MRETKVQKRFYMNAEFSYKYNQGGNAFSRFH